MAVMSLQEYRSRAGLGLRRRNKYGNKQVRGSDQDGKPITLESKREAKRWQELVLLARKGIISGLQRQVPYHFWIVHPIEGQMFLTYSSNRKVKYIADFQYYADGRLVVEDAKSEATRTPAYKIKWALMALHHGIEVREL